MNNQELNFNIDKIFYKICQNVKHQRSLTGLTQEKYAEALGVSSQYINQIECSLLLSAPDFGADSHNASN